MFFCVSFLLLSSSYFPPRLVCLCRAGFSQLCSPRRAFSEQGPLRLIKSASFFSGWRCQLHALLCARVCLRVGGASSSSRSSSSRSSAGSESLECNALLVWPWFLDIMTNNMRSCMCMCMCMLVCACLLSGAGGCSCSPAVLGCV